ncbi:coadhesin-like [Actinia tenebrosa]|uniref:Coadhesin-like n=1 Tax=Actinia tenebrosa TaxID=6105 RepID=A0A6P8J2A1_ACTTE|nr:coadhesin-like [Actinia tenebrosa]
MGMLSTWISLIALLGLIQVKGIISLDLKSCNASKLIEEGKELGIRGNLIPDESFYASSVSDASHGPQRGRLDQRASGGQGSSWCSQQANSMQWLAVDLVYTAIVTGIATQGQNDPDSLGANPNYTQSWVTKFTLEYSNDNDSYFSLEYKTEKPLVFNGNTDGNSIVCHELPYEITARYLRFRPKEWNANTICLRIGVFGNSLGANATLLGDPTEEATGDPGHEAMWWWPFFWVLLAVILTVLILGLLFYWCIVRKRTYSQEKYIKIKPAKAPIQRRQQKSYVNEAYDMAVVTKSGATTPETVEELDGDEIQEVTAEFTANEQENKNGIVGFSVTDDNDKPDGEEEVANGDVNWEKYRKKALQRPEHTYVNVKDINNEI